MTDEIDKVIAAKRRTLADLEDRITQAVQRRNAAILAATKAARNIIATAEREAAAILEQARGGIIESNLP